MNAAAVIFALNIYAKEVINFFSFQVFFYYFSSLFFIFFILFNTHIWTHAQLVVVKIYSFGRCMFIITMYKETLFDHVLNTARTTH